VQISVVVANIQARTLKAEVEKGFLRTAVGQELIDPKTRINLVKRAIGGEGKGVLFPFSFAVFLFSLRGVSVDGKKRIGKGTQKKPFSLPNVRVVPTSKGNRA